MAKELKLLNPTIVHLAISNHDARKIVELIGNYRDEVEIDDDLSDQEKEDIEVRMSELQDNIENAIRSREEEGEPCE